MTIVENGVLANRENKRCSGMKVCFIGFCYGNGSSAMKVLKVKGKFHIYPNCQ